MHVIHVIKSNPNNPMKFESLWVDIIIYSFGTTTIQCIFFNFPNGHKNS